MQHFCRGCGLELDAIAADLAAQKPSPELAEAFRRHRRMQMIGVACLSTAGIIGLCLILGKAFYYKLAIFGPELLFGSAVGALIFFLIASVFFFNFKRPDLDPDRENPRLRGDETPVSETNKLLGDPPFEPASVTEHSTELLDRRR